MISKSMKLLFSMYFCVVKIIIKPPTFSAFCKIVDRHVSNVANTLPLFTGTPGYCILAVEDSLAISVTDFNLRTSSVVGERVESRGA